MKICVRPVVESLEHITRAIVRILSAHYAAILVEWNKQ
jgi:hypothetical protein